ncbi:MAG TPA: VCBS repeat-containing protein, partial [Candidatus Paceibacterota bacterium]|nr:VCBS repeat-containing protein [Candidatus Paceibacterota bacterium]
DGVYDIIWKRPDNKHVLWFMNKTGGATSARVIGVLATWTFIATGDFNADGIFDIIWQRPDNKYILCFMNEDGTIKSNKLLFSLAQWILTPDKTAGA